MNPKKTQKISSNNTHETYTYLPDELLLQILLKLPAKSVLRFRCVSKSWCSLITNSNFILQHLHHSSNYSVLFRKHLELSSQEIYTLHSDNQQFDELETLVFPFQSRCHHFKIIGCVNGLICLSDNFTITLWNPAIRKFLTVPTLNMEKPGSPVDSVRVLPGNTYEGFGYDASSNDFKVVKIKLYTNMSKITDQCTTRQGTVAVYSLRNKSWRRSVSFRSETEFCSSACFVGNFIYWVRRVTNCMASESCKVLIVSFDLSAEEFTEIDCPDDVLIDLWRRSKVANFRDSLALIARVYDRDCVGTVRHHVWVMREDGVAKSWMKLFSVVICGGVPRELIYGFSKKGLVLIVRKGAFSVIPVVEDALVVDYVPSSPQSGWHVESYKESLFLLLDGENHPVTDHYQTLSDESSTN